MDSPPARTRQRQQQDSSHNTESLTDKIGDNQSKPIGVGQIEIRMESEETPIKSP
jgi:hypothetical protein